jgi:hypothetical protein
MQSRLWLMMLGILVNITVYIKGEVDFVKKKIKGDVDNLEHLTLLNSRGKDNQVLKKIGERIDN